MKKITLDSRVKDVYENPIGRDIIRRVLLQMNLSVRLIENPIAGRMKLGTVKRITGRKLGSGFYDTLVELLNHETDIPGGDSGTWKHVWWKEAVFYQIYPRSFCDGNGDGTGDLAGIESRLDYLKELGVNALWLSPVYDSPNDDNGYDIRNYRKIWEVFGTVEDFDRLLREIHKRGMKLIMDLVVNHTSDEHEWFQKALQDKNSPYGEYYFFREGKGEGPPNNWTSFFSGSAWKYFEERGEWGLHLFSGKQMDLNWENPALRREIVDMIRWWLDKGVDGFRMDVINYISKTKGLPQGDELVGALMGYYGIEHYFYGPRLHEYLKEIREKAFAPYEAFSVGETPGIGMEMSKLITGDDRGELDMVFSFDHLENPGHVRFEDYRYDLNHLKGYYIEWMEHYGDHCWMSLFLENHDNPRMVSKVEPDRSLHPALAKLLLAVSLTLRGTPFIYQGQELGESNVEFHSIDEMRDVESIRLYQELSKKMTQEEAFRIVLSGSRDHARAMMDWSKAQDQLRREDSVRSFCRKLTALRRESRCLIYGSIRIVHKKTKNYFAYYREMEGEVWFVECNLGSRRRKRPGHLPEVARENKVLSNYDGEQELLEPYQVNIYVSRR